MNNVGVAFVVKVCPVVDHKSFKTNFQYMNVDGIFCRQGIEVIKNLIIWKNYKLHYKTKTLHKNYIPKNKYKIYILKINSN